MDISDLNPPEVVQAVRKGRAKFKYNVDTSAEAKGARTCNGYVFDSASERDYYRDVLSLKQAAGDIRGLLVHPRYIVMEAFEIRSGHVNAVTFKPDFSFIEERDGEFVPVVLDVKGVPPSGDFMLRVKLFLRLHPDVEFRLARKVRGDWEVKVFKNGRFKVVGKGR
jgi:hypothetical protein